MTAAGAMGWAATPCLDRRGLGAGDWGLGKHSMVWNAEGMTSGVYFVRLSAISGQQSVMKVMLAK